MPNSDRTTAEVLCAFQHELMEGGIRGDLADDLVRQAASNIFKSPEAVIVRDQRHCCCHKN